MKKKENNIKIVKREKEKFRINKIYLIQIKKRSKTVDKYTESILVRCIKKYKTYALFDALDDKGNRLYTTTIDYIDDSYRYKKVEN